jgi:hypothetical protein
MKMKNYKFKRVGNFKYLGVILNEDKNHQIHLQERINNANKTYFMLQFKKKIKTYLKIKVGTKEHNNRQNVNICIRNLDTNKEREKSIEHFLEESV